MNDALFYLSIAGIGFAIGVIVAGAMAQAHYTKKRFKTRRSYRIQSLYHTQWEKKFVPVGRVTIEYDLAERECFFYRDICRMFPDKVIIDEKENF